MPNLRIIYNNVADEATSLAADSTAGSLVAEYVQNDFKGQAHRSAATSVVFTYTWATAVQIGGCFFMTNLSASGTGRLQLYSDTACTVQIADTGTINVATGENISLWNWTVPINANAFAYGGIVKSALWFATHVGAVKGAKLTLNDPTNAAGYIDTARVGMGSYWEAPYNPTSLVVTSVDTTENERNDAGDLVSDRGTQHETMMLELRALAETDRAQLMRVARSCGKSRPVFISGFPNDAAPVLEQDHMIYGKFSTDEAAPEDVYLNFTHKREVEGW